VDDRDLIPPAGQPPEMLWSDGLTRPDGVLSGDSLAADVTGPPAIVAEWALWGKEAQETGYHVLRCSNGPLRAQDFSEVITRYSPGELEGLPEYTVSWIPGANREPEYVAMGIHELAPADPQRADGRSRRDAVGREIVFVRLFCMRYADLAELSPSYQDLVQAADQVQFPAAAADPVTLTLPAQPSPIPGSGTARRLAERVAALLLTGHPVCVLGADDIPVAERLRFIDTVMAMLPYGLRATMSAATWAGSTSQDLKLRLFFSGAPRVGGRLTDGRPRAEDCLVEWAHPEAVHVTGDAGLLYQDWLKDVRGQAPALLAEQASPVRFNSADIRHMVGNLPKDKGVAETLDDLGQSMLIADRSAIKTAIRRLQRYLAGEHKPADLIDYQRRVRAGHLLADDGRLSAALKRELYDVLLRVAFGVPLTYAGYCSVEECAGVPLHAPLRAALVRSDAADCLTWVLARETRPGSRSGKSLDELRQQRMPAAEPLERVVRAVAAQALRPAHGPIVLDFALRYLWKYSEDPRTVLARHGYLAWQHEYIYPGDLETQVKQLVRVLGVTFGGPLSRSDIDEVFGQPGYPPTVALEEAVVRMTDRRNRGYVREQVAAAILRSRGFPSQTVLVRRQRLWWPPQRWPWWRRGHEAAAGQRQSTPQLEPAGQPDTVPLPPTIAPPPPARLRNRVLFRDSAWAHPRITVVTVVLLLVLVAAVFLITRSVLHG
jgi:hypothetical protein